MSVKQKEVADALNLTKGAVSQLVRKGMPLTSVEDARLWRINRGTRHKIPPETAQVQPKTPKKRTTMAEKQTEIASKDVQPPRPNIDFDPCENKTPAEIAARQARNAAIWADWFISIGDLEHARAWSDSFARLQKRANETRADEIALAEKEGSLVGREEVYSAIGIILSHLRRSTVTSAARLAGRVTPEDARIFDEVMWDSVQNAEAMLTVKANEIFGDE